SEMRVNVIAQPADDRLIPPAAHRLLEVVQHARVMGGAEFQNPEADELCASSDQRAGSAVRPIPEIVGRAKNAPRGGVRVTIPPLRVENVTDRLRAQARAPGDMRESDLFRCCR